MPNTQVRPAVLVFPGGGITFAPLEAEPIAMASVEGYQALSGAQSVKMQLFPT
jgi:hypothetical protein